MVNQLKYKEERIQFEEEIKRRNITKLVHFTKVENLCAIIGRKILPRSVIEKVREQVAYESRANFFNIRDCLRLDEKKEYNCLSIEHPNSFMFKKKQQEDPGIWCVIAIKPYYLYLKDTLFSIANAASNFSKSQGISGNFADFLALFKEEIIETRFRGTRQKDRRGLRECYPTHEQAEVLVKDCIGFEDFISICFKDESELSEAKQQLITTGRPRKGYPSKEAISKFIVDKQLWLDWATIKES